MSTVEPETLAVSALRDHLLNKLPAKCAAINAGRAALIRAGRPGPYAITAGMGLSVGTAPEPLTMVALIAGTRSAAEVAAELAGVAGLGAAVDPLGRLILAASAAPVDAASEVTVGADETGANVLFGWNPGGERNYRNPIVPPLRSGILDGDFHELPLMGRFGIIIGDKITVTDGPVRRDMHLVTMNLVVHVPVPEHGEGYGELAAQCVRAIREVIVEDRTLEGRVERADPARAVVMGTAFRFETGSSPVLARADLQIQVKVFQRS